MKQDKIFSAKVFGGTTEVFCQRGGLRLLFPTLVFIRNLNDIPPPRNKFLCKKNQVKYLWKAKVFKRLLVKKYLLTLFYLGYFFSGFYLGGGGKICPTHEVYLKVIFWLVLRLICHRNIPNHHFRPKNIKYLKNRKICNRNSKNNFIFGVWPKIDRYPLWPPNLVKTAPNRFRKSHEILRL